MKYPWWWLIVCLAAKSISATEDFTWVEDWYDIEVILFVQPPAIYDNESIKEQLLVAGPSQLRPFKSMLFLTSEEKLRYLQNSPELDLTQPEEGWFFNDRGDLVSHLLNDTTNERQSSFEFPDWLLRPGDDYEPLLYQVFSRMPFGLWYVNEFLDEPTEDQEEGSVEVEPLYELEAEVELSERELALEELKEKHEEFRTFIEESALVANSDSVRLVRTKQRLADNDYQVLRHFHWHQQAARLNSGDKMLYTLDYPYEIEGYFGLERGRYLHLNIHLWLHPQLEKEDVENPVFMLQESRRVVRGEVNYFDHPKFGILVQVQRKRIPSDIVSLANSLQ